MARERGKSTDWPKGLACLKHRDSSMVLPYLRLVFGCGDVPDFLCAEDNPWDFLNCS